MMCFSTGGEDRTPDTRFWRPVLYQLSYSRIKCLSKETLLLFKFVLIEHFGDLTRTNCTSTFTDSETQTYVQCYRID